MIKRHTKFPQITGLDQELDLLVKAIEELTGKIVTELPNVNSVNEFAKFFVKQSDGSYDLYEKINDSFIMIKGNIGKEQTYSITNVTALRTYDANSVTINELADVVGTLINDSQNGGLVK